MRSNHISLVLVKAEEDGKDVISVLQFLHVVQISRAQGGENLSKEVLVCCKELSDVVRVLIVDAVVIDDQVLDEVHDLFLEAQVEG